MKKFAVTALLALACSSATAQEPNAQRSGDARSLKRELRAERIDSMRTRIKERLDAMKPNYNADSVRAVLENAPYFSIFKDNYFIGGVPVGQKIMASNSNVKFQLSVQQRLTKSKLPFDTYLMLQFTEKVIWNIAEESLPMRDMNFNPGIGLGHLIVHRNKYIGRAYLMIEHESNGKDGLASRSWNKISAYGSALVSRHLELNAKAWIPIIDSDNNRDILEYNGLAQLGINYRSANKRLQIGMLATWRTKSFSFNTQWDISYKLNNRDNQYLFLQYYNGYGENLLDYNQYKSVLRMGIVIKPRDFSIF